MDIYILVHKKKQLNIYEALLTYNGSVFLMLWHICGNTVATKINSLQPQRLQATQWRRRDSNPRPEVLIHTFLRVQSIDSFRIIVSNRQPVLCQFDQYSSKQTSNGSVQHILLGLNRVNSTQEMLLGDAVCYYAATAKLLFDLSVIFTEMC